MSKIQEKKLFKPDAVVDERIYGGETTNLLDLSNIPKDYEIFHKLVDTAYSNNWLPHKVDMSSDVGDYKHRLTDEEKEVFDDLISFLAFLDSLQVNNLPNIFKYITSPHVVYGGARQVYDEAVHAKSYGWILSSLMSKEDAGALYNKWKVNPILFDRNKFIANIYQDFVDGATKEGFLRVLIANYLLEGLYFYNAFQFFHTLANRGLMSGTDTQISYIQRDELVHCSMFQHILKILFKENPEFLEMTPIIEEMFKEAVEWEIKFSQELIGDRVLGMSKRTVEDNAHYLANKRLKDIGLKQIFPKAKNPYVHLDKQSGTEDESSNRSNNFEVTSIAYKSPEIFNDWDDI